MPFTPFVFSPPTNPHTYATSTEGWWLLGLMLLWISILVSIVLYHRTD